ncbi:hypothetical protein [Pararhodonellum marinum]|uniref:hypothetical protein n=1 Tax=Pararhodonellum marinum TaxID=2755358 RepID=UPI00188FB3B3|nr:hypothetical protein [Pararhodonellum marinum]
MATTLHPLNFLSELFRRNTLLAWFGSLSLLTFFVLLILSFSEERTFAGINIWIKPMKFLISLWIFAWTMAWLLWHLPQKRKIGTISWGIVFIFFVEMAIIIRQAARGVGSHYNVSTFQDMILFQIMGIAIVLNTLLVFWAFMLYAKVDNLPKGYHLAIRLGMLIFILASFEGFFMTSNLGHTVGAKDGVEGIFFLNWAKAYGDLRVAHFLGLHALQVLPLVGWFFFRHKTLPVWIFGSLYFLFSFAMLWNALAGRAFYDWGI